MQSSREQQEEIRKPPSEINEKKQKKKTEWERLEISSRKLDKKDLHDPDNHNGVITHLEPDILECEVKWTLENITKNKLVEVMEFQLSYFKS